MRPFLKLTSLKQAHFKKSRHARTIRNGMRISTELFCLYRTKKQSFSILPIREVTDLEGTIEFWGFDDLNRYYIRVYVQGTIDSVVLGFVDDLDDEFKQEGLKVIFSGTYEKSDNNPRSA